MDGFADVGSHIVYQAIQHVPELLNEEDQGLRQSFTAAEDTMIFEGGTWKNGSKPR